MAVNMFAFSFPNSSRHLNEVGVSLGVGMKIIEFKPTGSVEAADGGGRRIIPFREASKPSKATRKKARPDAPAGYVQSNRNPYSADTNPYLHPDIEPANVPDTSWFDKFFAENHPVPDPDTDWINPARKRIRTRIRKSVPKPLRRFVRAVGKAVSWRTKTQ